MSERGLCSSVQILSWGGHSVRVSGVGAWWVRPPGAEPGGVAVPETEVLGFLKVENQVRCDGLQIDGSGEAGCG